jgi:hypothetical protein
MTVSPPIYAINAFHRSSEHVGGLGWLPECPTEEPSKQLQFSIAEDGIVGFWSGIGNPEASQEIGTELRSRAVAFQRAPDRCGSVRVNQQLQRASSDQVPPVGLATAARCGIGLLPSCAGLQIGPSEGHPWLTSPVILSLGAKF